MVDKSTVKVQKENRLLSENSFLETLFIADDIIKIEDVLDVSGAQREQLYAEEGDIERVLLENTVDITLRKNPKELP